MRDTVPAATVKKRKKKLYVIETDLTDEEIALQEAAEQEYITHPENFISLDDFLAGKRI
jgi:hypothetical protein